MPSSEAIGQGAVTAVVVDFHSGDDLRACCQSLLAEQCTVVVVDNGATGTSAAMLGAVKDLVTLLETGVNLGFGGGVNRGVAVAATPLVLVCNPDLVVHDGAVAAMVAALDAEPDWALVGPKILDSAGETYPSVRRFPSLLDAVGHALLAPLWPKNPFTARYRSGYAVKPKWGVDWISGACFLIRREAFEALGGFDEGFFMFAEDLDLCFRAHQLGFGIGYVDRAVVTHVEGVSRRRQPYKMLLAHHRSAFRFQAKHARGAKVLLLPFAAVVLALRLVVATATEFRARSSE